MKASTLKLLKSKYPQYTEQQLKLIVGHHLNAINTRIRNNTTLDISIPRLGRIHTHGNAKNKSYKHRLKMYNKRYKKLNLFTDSVLLF